MNLHRLHLHLAQLKVPMQMGKYSNQIKCKLYISHGYILNYKLLSSFPVFHTRRYEYTKTAAPKGMRRFLESSSEGGGGGESDYVTAVYAKRKLMYVLELVLHV